MLLSRRDLHRLAVGSAVGLSALRLGSQAVAEGSTSTVPKGVADQPKPTTSTVSIAPTTRGGGATLAAYINGLPPYTLIDFAPGIYDLTQINPKEGQYFRGKPADPTAVVLDGRRTTGRPGNMCAFFGGTDVDGIKNVRHVTIEGLKITNYTGGMPRTFAVQPTGTSKDAKAQLAAIQRPGFGWIVQDCQIVANFSSGIHWTMDGRISRCVIADNGSTGVAGGSELHAALLEDCDIYNNSRWHMNPHWEAGGVKNSRSIPAGAPFTGSCLITGCKIHGNWGPGIWFDYQGYGGEISRCSIYDNAFSAIQQEVGTDLWVHHNQMGNNCKNGSGLFKAEFMFQNSKDGLFENNLVYVSRLQSFFVGQQKRSGSPFVGFATAHGNVIRDNVFCITSSDGAFAYLHDWGSGGSSKINCTGVTSDAPKPGTNCPEIGNHFCYVARTGTGNTLSVTFANNTIRTGSGSFKVNARYAPSGTRFGKDPASFRPDWAAVPTWDLPPGKL